MTVNLAMALAAQGRKVGVLDADIYGHSVPAMLGRRRLSADLGRGHDHAGAGRPLKVISIGMLKPRRDQVVAWRGPILDRALTQMLADVYWGDLDFLLLDLPPGTGDVAISLGQKLPNAEVLVVTTPQAAAAEVAERAGTMASMMNQRVIGVVENMSYLEVTCPHCGEPHRHEIFGSGGGATVARTLEHPTGLRRPAARPDPAGRPPSGRGDDGKPPGHHRTRPAGGAGADRAGRHAAPPRPRPARPPARPGPGRPLTASVTRSLRRRTG